MTDPSMTTRRIVLIEDDEDVSDFLEAFLADRGYEVRAAKDGDEGLRLVQDFMPDLVILDLMMPNLDGYGFLRALAASPLPLSPKVIVLTAVQKMGGREEALQLGAADFLTKPVDHELLLEKIRQLLRPS